jgi:hypothetical protein
MKNRKKGGHFGDKFATYDNIKKRRIHMSSFEVFNLCVIKRSVIQNYAVVSMDKQLRTFRKNVLLLCLMSRFPRRELLRTEFSDNLL